MITFLLLLPLFYYLFFKIRSPKQHKVFEMRVNCFYILIFMVLHVTLFLSYIPKVLFAFVTPTELWGDVFTEYHSPQTYFLVVTGQGEAHHFTEEVTIFFLVYHFAFIYTEFHLPFYCQVPWPFTAILCWISFYKLQSFPPYSFINKL